MSVKERLKNLGITLPEPVSAVANYVPTHMGRDGTVFVSGQISFANGKIETRGLLGDTVSIQEGYDAAKLCAINVLSQVSAAVDGDLDRVTACRKLTVYVAATADFAEHPKVANGASDLIVDVLGERGRHARSAIGVASLPFNVPIEVEAIFEVARILE